MYKFVCFISGAEIEISFKEIAYQLKMLPDKDDTFISKALHLSDVWNAGLKQLSEAADNV